MSAESTTDTQRMEDVVETIREEYPDSTMEDINDPILGYDEKQGYVDFRSNGHYFAAVRQEHGLVVDRTMGLYDSENAKAHRVWFTEMEDN